MTNQAVSLGAVSQGLKIKVAATIVSHYFCYELVIGPPGSAVPGQATNSFSMLYPAT